MANLLQVPVLDEGKYSHVQKLAEVVTACIDKNRISKLLKPHLFYVQNQQNF